MRQDSILQNFYNSKLPKAEDGLGIRKPVEPYHPITNPSGYKGKVNLNTLMEEAKKKPAVKKYEPTNAVKNLKSTLAVASLVGSANPITQYAAQVAGGVGDLYTAGRYAADGQWDNAGIDAVQGVVSFIPYAKAAQGMKGDYFTRGAQLFNRILKGVHNANDLKTLTESPQSGPGEYTPSYNSQSGPKYKNGGPAYATGGVTCPTGQYWNGKQCVPFLPTGLEMAKQMRSPSTTGELEQLKSDVKGSDIARVNRATNKRQFVGPARASTPDSEAYRLATNKTYAAQNAPYTSIDESANLSQAFPNASMTGTPLTGSELERKYKGIHHITKGLEAAAYLTGAGELYKAGMIGTEALGAGASALESGEASGLSDVFWNGKSYQPTPLSNPRILSVQHGMDAVYAKMPNYDAHLWGRQGYVEPALEGPLAPYATTYDAEAPSVIWSDVNDQVKQNWFNKTPPKTSGFTWSPRGWFRDTPPVTPVTETTLEENLAAARNQAAGTKPPAAGKPGIKPKGKSSMWGKVGRGAAGIGLVTALPSLYRATMTSSIPESFSNMPVTGQSGDSTLGTTGVDTGAVYNSEYDTSGIPTNVMDSNQYMNTPDTGATALPSHARGGMITDPRGQWAHPGQNTRIPGGNITMQGVPYPVLGRADTGQSIMMQPGQNYNFEGANHVDEYPMMRQGGFLPKAQFGCHGKSCTQTGEGIKKKNSRLDVNDEGVDNGTGGFIDYAALNNAANWKDLLTWNSGDLDKKEKKQYDKGITARTAQLQSQFPGLTEDQIRVAGADSTRIRGRMADLPRYDKPSEQTYDRAYHNFYRPLMNQQTPVTVPQILQFQSQQPGGLGGFKQVVESNYGKKKAAYGGPLVDYYQGKMNGPNMFGPGGQTTDGCPPGWNKDARGNCVPGGFTTPTNTTDATGKSISEKLKQEAKAEEIHRKNVATNKRQFVGPARASTPDSEKERLRKNTVEANKLPNVQLDDQANLSVKNSDYTMSGEPATPTAQRRTEGVDRMFDAADYAGYLTGAGELINAGYKALKPIVAKSVEPIITEYIESKALSNAYKPNPSTKIVYQKTEPLTKKDFWNNSEISEMISKQKDKSALFDEMYDEIEKLDLPDVQNPNALMNLRPDYRKRLEEFGDINFKSKFLTPEQQKLLRENKLGDEIDVRSILSKISLNNYAKGKWMNPLSGADIRFQKFIKNKDIFTNPFFNKNYYEGLMPKGQSSYYIPGDNIINFEKGQLNKNGGEIFKQGGEEKPKDFPIPYSNEFIDKYQQDYNNFYAPPRKNYYGIDDGYDAYFNSIKGKAPFNTRIQQNKGPAWEYPNEGSISYRENFPSGYQNHIDKGRAKKEDFKYYPNYISEKNIGDRQSSDLTHYMLSQANKNPNNIFNFGEYEKGGQTYSKGGEYDMSDADIQNLIKQGYKIEYV